MVTGEPITFLHVPGCVEPAVGEVLISTTREALRNLCASSPLEQGKTREGCMRIEVGPARRAGDRFGIYDKPLEETDLDIGPRGDITLTIDAAGMKDERSRYRYRISFSSDEASRLAGARGGGTKSPASFE